MDRQSRRQFVQYEPARSERVFVSMGNEVKASANGGVTWIELGHPQLGAVHRLTMGIDARYLYAATNRALWRLRLDGLQHEPADRPDPGSHRPPRVLLQATGLIQ